MRITNNMLVTNLLSNVNRNLVNMTNMQEQLASGKRVKSASDDPVAASKILKYKTDIAENEQYSRNANDALSWLDMTESTMMDMDKVLQRARELAVKASNGTNADEDLKKIADELEQLKKQLISDANFSSAGGYIFSGYNTQEALLNDDGTYVTPLTDIDINNPAEKKYQIGIGEDIKVSTNGIDLFGVVEETGAFIEKMPNGKSTDAVASVQSEMKIKFDPTLDHASGGQIRYNIASQTYDLDMSDLDLSSVDPDNPLEVQNAKETVINALRGARANPATVPETTMSDAATIYFDADDQIVIRSKNYGMDYMSEVVIGGTSGFRDKSDLGVDIKGSVTTFMGSDATEATLSMESLEDYEVAENFNGKEFVITLDGKSEKIKIEELPDPATVDDLKVALQNSIDSKFGTGELIVSELQGVITFSSNSKTPGGEVPSLEIRPVTGVKSQMVQDFDDVIAAINDGDREAVESFIEDVDKNLEKVLTNLSDVGARTNRMDLVISRIGENNITFTKLLSLSQDTDITDVIMKLKNAENVYNASLSTGAKVIQPTLIDFLR